MKKRSYKKEYANYQGTEEQKKKRAKRNAARRKATKAGKVRGQTTKIEGRKIVGTNAKLRNKSNFRK